MPGSGTGMSNVMLLLLYWITPPTGMLVLANVPDSAPLSRRAQPLMLMDSSLRTKADTAASRADAVAALVHAGVGVDRVVPRRRLEDAFLSLVGGDTKASGER